MNDWNYANFVLWFCLLACSTGLFFVCLWPFLSKRRRERSTAFDKPVQQRKPPSRAPELILSKQKTLPPGFDRKVEAGLYPLSQVVAAAFQAMPSSTGLYAVTFAPETLAALRSGQAHLMHSVNGDRAIAVQLNGKIEGIGIVKESGFDALRACFATASLVTGQYFLARVDVKLNAIFTSVQEVLRHLDSAERAKLHQATSYLHLLSAAVRQGRAFGQDETEI